MRTEHHPDEEELALYAHKQLPSEREKVVQDHLRNCYECSWKVVEARKLRYKQEACLLSKVTTEFRRQFKCLLTEKQKVVLILVFGHHSRRTVRLQGMRYQAKGRVLHLDDIIGQPLVSWERGELLLRFRGTVPSWIRVRCQDSEIQQKVPVSGTLGIKIPLPDSYPPTSREDAFLYLQAPVSFEEPFRAFAKQRSSERPFFDMDMLALHRCAKEAPPNREVREATPEPIEISLEIIP